MKFWILYIIICAMLLSSNQAFASEYQNQNIASTQNWQISASQLSAAKLLQNYVANYKNKINNLHNTYGWKKSVAMSNFNFQTWNMYDSLNDILNNKYSATASSEIMSQIVSDLKVINTRMKVFLEQEKIIYINSIIQKQKELWKIWNQISQTLDSLILSVSNQLIKKQNLSQKEKRIVESLVTLREQNIKIKRFHTVSFHTHSEMNEYLKEVISAIRSEFQKIKRL